MPGHHSNLNLYRQHPAPRGMQAWPILGQTRNTIA